MFYFLNENTVTRLCSAIFKHVISAVMCWQDPELRFTHEGREWRVRATVSDRKLVGLSRRKKKGPERQNKEQSQRE